jgi:uncharacterized membrane protein
LNESGRPLSNHRLLPSGYHQAMSSSEHHHAPHGVDTARILAFSDGVFAIAITLLILELKVPHVETGLLRALLDEWPSYLSFVMSFVVIGVIWA